MPGPRAILWRFFPGYARLCHEPPSSNICEVKYSNRNCKSFAKITLKSQDEWRIPGQFLHWKTPISFFRCFLPKCISLQSDASRDANGPISTVYHHSLTSIGVEWKSELCRKMPNKIKKEKVTSRLFYWKSWFLSDNSTNWFYTV